MDLPLLFLCALLAALTLPASSSPSGRAYFVTNVESLSVGEPVDYEMRTASEFTSQLLTSIDAASDAGVALPRALFVLLSAADNAHALGVQVAGKSGSTDIAPVASANSVSSIKKALQAAPSSTVFTSLGHSCEGPSLKDALLAEAGRKHFVSGTRLGGACAKDGSHDLQAFLTSWAADAAKEDNPRGMDILVYCLPAAAQGSASADTPGSSFAKAYSILQNQTSHFAALLVPDTVPSGRSTCSRSLLLAHPPPAKNGTCDETCMTRATLIEVMLVAAVMLIALVSGLCCLVDLDSPTRFEVPAEST